MLAGLAILAGVAYLASGGRSRGGLSQPLLPSSGEREIPSGSPEDLWPVKPEDFVHPAKRMEARQRAQETGGRWALIGRDGAVYARYKTREEAFNALKAAGYQPPKPRPGQAVTAAESEGWAK